MKYIKWCIIILLYSENLKIFNKLQSNHPILNDILNNVPKYKEREYDFDVNFKKLSVYIIYNKENKIICCKYWKEIKRWFRSWIVY